MAGPGGIKRKSASTSTTSQSRKKRKLATSHITLPARKKKNGFSKSFMRKVRPDELKWQGIAPPDQLDDYEGFYGLEEVDGVDVLRDETTGQISFQANADSMAVKDSLIATEEQGAVQSIQSSRLKAKNNDSGSGDDHQDDQPGGERASEVETSENEWTGLEDNSSDSAPDEGLEATEAADNPFALLEQTSGQDVDLSAWNSLNLSDESMEGLSTQGFSKPTPIQAAAIPPIRDGRDIIGKAPTGSGKTLAFGIPILEKYLDMKDASLEEAEVRTKASPVALIILPTRELARQIEDHLKALSSRASFEGPNIATITGGLSIQKQRRILEYADVVVATPGRLWEVVSEQNKVMERLRKTQFLVVDEADRLLKDGQFKELSQVLYLLDRADAISEGDPGKDQTGGIDDRKTLVFSATFSTDLQHKLAKQSWHSISKSSSTEASMTNLLRKLKFRDQSPLFIDVNPTAQMAPLLHESLLECPDGMDKDLYLYGLLLMSGITQRTLIFVNSISAVRRLLAFLGNLNMPALPLQSHMPQKARLRSVERFTAAHRPPGLATSSASGQKQSAQPKILIATDVAARGLDIPEVGLIVHYNLPRTSDTYVHRSGRTARASNKGTSVLLCAPQEAAGMRRLVAQIHAKDAVAQQSEGQDDYENAGRSRKGKKKQPLQAVTLDSKVLSRLKPRTKLAKQIADAELAREKGQARDAWVQNAAHELGAELDSSEGDQSDIEGIDKRRGSRKKKKSQQTRKDRENAARAMTKAQLKVARAQLRELLSQRVNTGVSERYLAGSGRVDMHKLLEERERGVNGLWLGSVPGLGLETSS